MLYAIGKENGPEQKVTVMVGGKFNSKPLLPTSRPNSTDTKILHVKTQGSLNCSMGDSLSGSKASINNNNLYCRALNNEPVTHQKQVDERSDYQPSTTFLMENVSFARKSNPFVQPGSDKIESDKPLSIEFRYRQLEFQCATLKQTIRSLEQRQFTEEQWRTNKLKEAHDKVSELSRKLEQQSTELHNERLTKKKLEAEVMRLNSSIKEYEGRLQDCAREVEQSEHSERRALERLSISHKQQIDRLEARERSITNQLQSVKQKKLQLEKDLDQVRHCNSQLNTELAQRRCSQAKVIEQAAAGHQKTQVERETLLTQLNNLQAEAVLVQARANSEFKLLRTDFDNAVNLIKVKDKTIAELTDKLQTLQISSNQQLESYKHSKASLEGKLAQLERQYLEETTVKHEQFTGQRSELELMLRELASAVDAYKHENGRLQADIEHFRGDSTRLVKQLSDTTIKLETLEETLSLKVSEIESLRRERSQLLEALENIPNRVFHLQPPKVNPSPDELRRQHRSSTNLSCHNSISLERPKLRTEQAIGSVEFTAKCRQSPARRQSHHKLNNCASARHSIAYADQPHPQRPYIEREQQTLNQAILRRCQLIIGQRYGKEGKRS